MTYEVLSFCITFNYFHMPRTSHQNLPKNMVGFQISTFYGFQSWIFKWTKYDFAHLSPLRVTNNHLHSEDRTLGNNSACETPICHVINSSYSRCLVKPAIKPSKHCRDKIRLKSNHGTLSNTSPLKTKRTSNPFP